MTQRKPSPRPSLQVSPNGKHPLGRPTKLTPEVQTTIVNALASGVYLETAASVAGISRDTLNAWLKNGAQCKSGVQKDFSDAIKKALATAETRLVDTVNLASQQQWQAAMTLLERRWPQRWGRVERHENTGEGGGPIVVRVIYDEPHKPGVVIDVESRDLPELE